MAKKKGKIQHDFIYSPLIVSVDPGKIAAYCIFREGKSSLGFGLIHCNQTEMIYSFLRKVGEGCDRPLLVTEDQFHLKSINSTKVLVERRMRWVVCAELLGWDVRIVHPASWQSQMFRGIAGETTKDKSIKLFKSEVGTEPQSHDIADAFAMGKFWLNGAKMKLEQEGRKSNV